MPGPWHPGCCSADEVAEVLRAAGLPQPDVPRMLTETRGLPMLVREYAEALRAAGPAGRGRGMVPARLGARAA